MITEHDITRLNQLCDKYEALLRPIKVSDHNSPLNRNEEKSRVFEAFAEQRVYNPSFQYQAPPLAWGKPLTEFLQELNPYTNEWEQYLYRDARKAILELEAVSSHDANEITAETIHSHGIPSPELVEKARGILETTAPESEDKNIPAHDAAEKLSSALVNAGLSDWIVELKQPMNARMMVRSVEKKVFVREDASFSEDSIKRLMVHEIGTHVFRYINGERQALKLLKLGLIGYLDTEEGLATYHEKYFGIQDITALQTYALRAIAAHLSLTSSFHEIFVHLSQYSSDLDQIFDIVTRAKRGFIDTSQVGGHVKDQVYLMGFLNISEYLSLYPQDHSILMCGKVSLAMIEKLRELEHHQLLVPPQFMPSDLIDPE